MLLRIVPLRGRCLTLRLAAYLSRPAGWPNRRGGRERGKSVGIATCATESVAQVDIPADFVPAICRGRYSDRFCLGIVAQVDFPTDSAPAICTGRFSDRILSRKLTRRSIFRQIRRWRLARVDSDSRGKSRQLRLPMARRVLNVALRPPKKSGTTFRCIRRENTKLCNAEDGFHGKASPALCDTVLSHVRIVIKCEKSMMQ